MATSSKAIKLRMEIEEQKRRRYQSALSNLLRDGSDLGDNCDEVAAKMLGFASIRNEDSDAMLRIADALTGLLALALGQRL